MRVNIYSQELTAEVAAFQKASDTGHSYAAVRLFLHSTPMLHDNATDDDRSAITFWLPRSAHRREVFAQTLEEMARLVRVAPPNLGVD